MRQQGPRPAARRRHCARTVVPPAARVETRDRRPDGRRRRQHGRVRLVNRSQSNRPQRAAPGRRQPTRRRLRRQNPPTSNTRLATVETGRQRRTNNVPSTGLPSRWGLDAQLRRRPPAAYRTPRETTVSPSALTTSGDTEPTVGSSKCLSAGSVQPSMHLHVARQARARWSRRPPRSRH